jgi:sugar lactone lactonase YvrE
VIPSGVGGPAGVALDAAGNIYVANDVQNRIDKWSSANNTVVTLTGTGFASLGVAVDSGGNAYFSDIQHNSVDKWYAVNHSLIRTTLNPEASSPQGVAVDAAGNIYVADDYLNAIDELPHGYVDTTPKFENNAAGSDVLPVILTGPANLVGPVGPNSDQPWLTITGVTNGVTSFSFLANTGPGRIGHISVLGQQIAITQSGVSVLAASNRLEGAASGVDSIVLSSLFTPWTATNNAPWLHVSPGYQSGTGGTNVVFSFDANPGPTRSGTLTIGGQILTVTQAGSTYVPAAPLTTLVSPAAGLAYGLGVVVDASGNVYIADRNNNAVVEWTLTNNTATTLVSSGLNNPGGVAVDGLGNVYIADSFNGALEEWVASSNTVITLASGFSSPYGVALDGVGNVYIGGASGGIQEWVASSNTVITLLSGGPRTLTALAVDAAGNVYFSDGHNGAIDEWSPADNSLRTLVGGLGFIQGVAVDSAGNVYFSNPADNTIKELSAATHTVITLATTIFNPTGVAVDAAGNVYFVNNATSISELPRAFVDTTAKVEGPGGSSDVLPVVLPNTENLANPFAPATDQPWLTFNGVTNGVVSFGFGANTGAVRTGHVIVLNQQIPVTQGVQATLIQPQMLGNGTFQFAFTNVPGVTFTVWSTTNLSQPLSNWTLLGTPVEGPPGQYQFTGPATNARLFYILRSP